MRNFIDRICQTHFQVGMAKKVVAITSVVGTRDTLIDEQVSGEARFVAFVDRPLNSVQWDERTACSIFRSARRNSRAPKILATQFVEAEYSIWVDAVVAFRVPPEQVIEDWLQHHDMAVFAHESRACTYEEGEECSRRKLDDPLIISRQMNRYRALGFPANSGLGRCTIIARRHSQNIANFNNLWWSEWCSGSVRDQLSFMFAVKMSGVRVRMINKSIFCHPYFSIRSRAAEPELYY